WQNNTDPDPELQSLSFYYPNGINDFVNEELDKKNLLIPNTFFGSSTTKSKDGKVEWSLLWSAGDKNKLKSFCNTIPTIYGGTHETAFKSAILKSIKNYAEIIGIRNSKIITLDDIVSCMDGVLSIFINEPEFQGQTKEKLSSKNATTITSSIIADNFDHWLSENSSEAEKLINFFISTANSRISKKHEKDFNRKSALRKLRLPGKLADCLEEKAEGTELFIVEGDSAGGSAKQARDKKYQAVLPLRGKILNVANSSAQKYYQNQQLKDLVQTLGCGTSDNYTDENLRYEKVIIMTDADVDGAHIAALLITFFFKEMPQLIVNNHLFLAVPPLYKITGGNNILYAIDDNDREMIIEKKFKKSKVEISRFKGLGEMLPNQLRDTTMKKETRKLVQVSINNSPIEYYELIIDQLMGSKADARFKFIQENANFYANT
ncbi:MAG: toprim domain-containing protein, partial [Hyphomicrobiales bacterium]